MSGGHECRFHLYLQLCTRLDQPRSKGHPTPYTEPYHTASAHPYIGLCKAFTGSIISRPRLQYLTRHLECSPRGLVALQRAGSNSIATGEAISDVF